jgi:misacylated tRNA(Ala) deacylase
VPGSDLVDLMPLPATHRLYLEAPDTFTSQGHVLAVRERAVALQRSCFYPGGGGQPADQGTLLLHDGSPIPLTGAYADAEGVVWHVADAPLPDDLAGNEVAVEVDAARRRAFSRYHTVLHVLNTIALRDHGGWITGAQIAADYARIDFKLDGVPAEMRANLEDKVNEVITQARPLRAYHLTQSEFDRRDDLLRTLEVKPPMHEGRVRIVEIEGFDAQACGGTHVRHTGELGRFSIERTENKGRINKRLYVKLD